MTLRALLGEAKGCNTPRIVSLPSLAVKNFCPYNHILERMEVKHMLYGDEDDGDDDMEEY